MAICDVTSATNTRTVLATLVPPEWKCGNTAPVLRFRSDRDAAAGVAVLNSMVFDWFARRLIAGLHLNSFCLEALCWPQLVSTQVNLLSSAGVWLQRLNPRWSRRFETGPGGELMGSYVETHVQVECIVAQAYGLSAEDVEVIYSESKEDRRGLWRHFSSDPHALVVAEEVRSICRQAASGESSPKSASPAGTVQSVS